MAKQRFINTRFWSDSFIVALTPIERYLFLYFLTNEHTSICGIYELPIRTIGFETGVREKLVLKVIERLNGKIYYVDGWVFIRNFERHQFARGNSKVKIGIANEKKSIPKEIIARIEEITSIKIKTDTPSKGYASGMEGASTLEPDSDSDFDSDLDPDSQESAPQTQARAETEDPTAKRNPDVDRIVVYLQEKIGLPKLDRSQKENRRMAFLSLKKFGLEQTLAIIDIAARDDYWKSRVTSVGDVYQNGFKIASTVRFTPKGAIQSL